MQQISYLFEGLLNIMAYFLHNIIHCLDDIIYFLKKIVHFKFGLIVRILAKLIS